ncbi:hypothetical protein [Gymnodinialimonas ulvae]|uniref:hypothetical protein n=1 Tax=Gymnodinialimonas ulvae TaxID=3126504 RepID=UPI00309ACD05
MKAQFYVMIGMSGLLLGCAQEPIPPTGPLLSELRMSAFAARIGQSTSSQERLAEAFIDRFRGVSLAIVTEQLETDGFDCQGNQCSFVQVQRHTGRGITSNPEPGFITRYLEIEFLADPVGGAPTILIEERSTFSGDE